MGCIPALPMSRAPRPSPSETLNDGNRKETTGDPAWTIRVNPSQMDLFSYPELLLPRPLCASSGLENE